MTSLMGTGLCMRLLAIRGVSAGESLMTRGLSCLGVVLIFSWITGLTIRIKAPKAQLVRALVAGLALSFYTLCYASLSASAVSTLSNIDVPMLLVLGPIVGVSVSKRVQVASIASILFLVLFVIGMEHNHAVWIGLVQLFVGTLLLCFGYWFIKRSMDEENEAVTIMVPALAIAVYGLIEWNVASHPPSPWTLELGLAATTSGVCMFLAYFSTMKLYRLTDIATAEFPTLIASLLIQPIEAVLLGEPTQIIYAVSTLGFIVTTYFILRWQNPVEVQREVTL